MPCIWRWPGVIPAGAVSGRFAVSTDVFPTVVDAGVVWCGQGRVIDLYVAKSHVMYSLPSPLFSLLYSSSFLCLLLIAALGKPKGLKIDGQSMLPHLRDPYDKGKIGSTSSSSGSRTGGDNRIITYVCVCCICLMAF